VYTKLLESFSNSKYRIEDQSTATKQKGFKQKGLSMDAGG
jgi:hypothetical protein